MCAGGGAGHHGSVRRTARPLAALLLAAAFSGCSAGQATVVAESFPEDDHVRLTITSEGRNTFTVAGASCEAPKGGFCIVTLPYRGLQGGWNELAVAGERRMTGEPPAARFFLGDEAFRRDCSVRPVTGGEPRQELVCRFDEGFAGELFGQPVGSRHIFAVADVPLDLFEGVGPAVPLAAVDLPLFVTNEAGGRFPRPMRISVPAPFVQAAATGWADPWYEESLPLRVRVEAGGQASINGEVIAGADGPDGAVKYVTIQSGPNEIRLDASKPGRLPYTQTLRLVGGYPGTPLYVEAPLPGSTVQTEEVIHLRGRTHPDAALYVDSRRAPIEADGTFAFAVPLNEGPNELAVLAALEGTGGNTLIRPPTKKVFQIEVNPRPVDEAEEFLQDAGDAADPKRLQAAVEAPLRHVGEKVVMSMDVESATSTPVSGGCALTLQGKGCTDEHERDVALRFSSVRARTCVGDRVPVQAELATCPAIDEGTRVRVYGEVIGTVGGRDGVVTVDRPRIAVSHWEEAPLIVGSGSRP